MGHPSGFDPEVYPFTDIVLQDLDVNQVCTRNYNFMLHIRENVLPYIDPGQIKFIVNQELRQNTDSVLREIFGFINVQYELLELQTGRYYNKQFRYDNINYDSHEYQRALRKLVDYYRPTISELYGFLGREIEPWKIFDETYSQMLS